jgi:hypothetical protein
MKKKLLLFLLLVFMSIGNLSAQNFEWAKNIGGTNSGLTEGYSVVSDAAGNTYVTGSFTGDTCFMDGLFVLNSGASFTSDIFIAKYDASGTIVWAKNAGGTSNDAGKGIAMDPMGNIYVTGVFRNTALFDTSSVTAANNNDIFLAKYDELGTLQWVIRGGGVNQDQSNGISVDAEGNSYITGIFWGTADFSGVSYTAISGNNADIFIAKYNSSGILQWLEQVGGVGLGGQFSNQEGKAISVETSGESVYVTGWFHGTVSWDSITITSNDFANSGEKNLFVAKYDSSGQAQWVQAVGAYQVNSSISPNAHAIAVYNEKVYVTGFVPGALIFNNDTIVMDTVPSPLSWHSDIFLAQYDTSGTFIWVEKPGGSDEDQGNGIGIDNSGDVFLTGYFSDYATFGSHIIGPVSSHAFLVKYDQAGTALWANNGVGIGGASANSISMDAAGHAYLVGSFMSSATFGSSNLTSIGSRDAFITKFNVTLIGIEEKSLELYFNLFPNPGTGLFSIEYLNPLTEKTYLNIYNLLGERVYTELLPVSSHTISKQLDLTRFEAGVYFVELRSAGRRTTNKLILLR